VGRVDRKWAGQTSVLHSRGTGIVTVMLLCGKKIRGKSKESAIVIVKRPNVAEQLRVGIG
jgi:hypothetical protein